MAKSFNKKELEKKKEQKRKEKQLRKEERKASGSKSFEDMIAYVDENGVISDTPPDLETKAEVELHEIEVSTPRKSELESEVATRDGRVDYFDPSKGYGFIKDAESGAKYFFHISNAPASIAEGLVVTFELERGVKGMNAVRIALKG